jgi:hypothetical protein
VWYWRPFLTWAVTFTPESSVGSEVLTEHAVYGVGHGSVGPAAGGTEQAVPQLSSGQGDVSLELATELPCALLGPHVCKKGLRSRHPLAYCGDPAVQKVKYFCSCNFKYSEIWCPFKSCISKP